MFSNIGAGFKSLAGGNIKGLTKLTSTARNELIVEITEKAKAIGANCIVATRFETNTLVDGMLDIVLYGTAVYCEWI